MEIRLVKSSDFKLLSKYFMENEKHFEEWEPKRTEDYHIQSEWKKRLPERELEQKNGKAAYFIAISDDGKNVIAHCSLTNINYGSFQACNIGYGVAKAYEGKGVMTMVCNKAIYYAFTELKLNRIMANYMPHNSRSASLLRKLGFVIEGEAKNYLKINGTWKDHVLTSLVNPCNT